MTFKKWGQHEVDEKLKEEWLEDLNSLSWNLTSVCYGHYENKPEDWKFGYAGSPQPNLDIAINSLGRVYYTDMTVSLLIKDALNKLPYTRAHTKWVFQDDGFIYNGSINDKLDKPIVRVIVGIDSTIKNNGNNDNEIDFWFETVISKLVELIGKPWKRLE